jgi:hypothetical protein
MCLGTPPCMHRCTAQRRNSQHMRGVSISRHPEHAQIQHKQTPCLCLVLTTFQQSVPSTINTSSFLLPPFSPPPTSVSGGHGMDPFSALARASWKHWQSSLAAPLYRCRQPFPNPESMVSAVFPCTGQRVMREAGLQGARIPHTHTFHPSPFVCACLA